jgi:hypothetical protein
VNLVDVGRWTGRPVPDIVATITAPVAIGATCRLKCDLGM